MWKWLNCSDGVISNGREENEATIEIPYVNVRKEEKSGTQLSTLKATWINETHKSTIEFNICALESWKFN